MFKHGWRISLLSLLVFSMSASVGSMGCLGGSEEDDDPNTCERFFENIDTQSICDDLVRSAGCDTPGDFQPLIGDCLGKNCTDCP